MGKLVSVIQFTGTVGGLNAYKTHESDQVYVREKPGVSRDRLKHGPEFVNTRRNNQEFKGRSRASRWIMRMMQPQRPLADYKIAGPLNALMKPVQEMDSQSNWGERSIRLSQCPQLLEGFSLNNRTTLDRVLRTPVGVELNKLDGQAKITVPALLPGINFFPATHAVYSVQATLGVIPDLFFSAQKSGEYLPASPSYERVSCVQIATPWLSTREKSEEIIWELNTNFIAPDVQHSLMVAIGIRYGIFRTSTYIEQVKRAGAAKIVGMV